MGGGAREFCDARIRAAWLLAQADAVGSATRRYTRTVVVGGGAREFCAARIRGAWLLAQADVVGSATRRYTMTVVIGGGAREFCAARIRGASMAWRSIAGRDSCIVTRSRAAFSMARTGARGTTMCALR